NVTGAVISAVNPAVAGSGVENISFTFTVKNNGFIDATNVRMDEAFTLVAGTTFSSSDSVNGGVFNGSDLGGVWNIPFLAAHDSATLTVNFTADHSVAHNSTATTVMTVGTADQSVVSVADDSDLESATIIRQNSLGVTIDDTPDPVGPTQSLTYTIVVTNNGP